MSKGGPILVVEDDSDDQETLEESFVRNKVENTRIYFQTADHLLSYLKETDDKPLAIISDFHLHPINGLDLKARIEADHELRKKSIPFIFLTTAPSRTVVDSAYTKHIVQGFFIKPDTIRSIDYLINTMVNYWQLCEHPNVK